MSTAPHLPLAELTTIAIRALIREVGVVNTARFLRQFSQGSGNYTLERDQIFANLSIDEIVRSMQPDDQSGEG
jgi:hypothetical protein